MAKKDVVSEIMNEGAEMINKKSTFNKIVDDLEKSVPPVKNVSKKVIKKIVDDTIKLNPSPQYNELIEEKTPDINYEIEEVTRYDINWLYLRQKLLEVMRLISYKSYERWFNETFNKPKLSKEDLMIKADLLESLNSDIPLNEEWLNVESHEVDTLLKNFPSITPINHSKPVDMPIFKTGKDFIDIVKNANNKEQTREFLIQELKRIEDESNLIRSELLNTVGDLND